MFKLILAQIRWGKLSQEQKEVLKTLPFGEVLSRPHLCPKLYIHY